MAYAARVTCPACGTQFQTPVEQVLDVRVNPEVKGRMLRGAVNVAACPSCGMGGPLNLPFIYHDPENEIALLYLPVEAGKTEMQRQRAAGRLTRQLLDALPPEERKGYLLQPETFISMDTMVRRVLEIEGIDEDVMERGREQQEALGAFIEAEEEGWPALLEEKAALIDESFFSLLQYIAQSIATAAPESENAAKVERLQEFLVEHHELGQRLQVRTEVLRPFMEDPNRETLLTALLAAPDEETVGILIQTGMPIMDYGFFQGLVKQIEAAESEEERARLKDLRRRILEARDELAEQSAALAQKRMDLLQRMLSSEEPLKMARSHLSELDDAFSYVIQQQLQAAQQDGEQKYFKSLSSLYETITQVMEENMPPHIVLVRRLLMTTSDEEIDALLDENSDLVQAPLVQFLESVEQESRENGGGEVADRLVKVRARVQLRVSPLASPVESASPAPLLGPGEQRGPGGLIISTKK